MNKIKFSEFKQPVTFFNKAVLPQDDGSFAEELKYVTSIWGKLESIKPHAKSSKSNVKNRWTHKFTTRNSNIIQEGMLSRFLHSEFDVDKILTLDTENRYLAIYLAERKPN